MQIEDDSEIHPPITGPDIADIARPLLIWPNCCKVTVHIILRNVERMIAICGRLEFACSFNDDAIPAHQSSDPAMP